MFPADRLQRAGATPEELTQIQAEFDARLPAEQENELRKLEAIAHGDLVEWLEDLRKAGRFAEEEAEEITSEVVAEAEKIVADVEHQEPESPKPGK